MKSIAAPVPLRARQRRIRLPLGAIPVGASSRIALTAVGFLALGGFALVRWAGLVENPPVGRAVACLAIATLGGIAIALTVGDDRRRTATRLGIAALTVALGLVAMGLAPRLLWPRGWGELLDGIGRATGAFETSEWPYHGPDEWIRLGTLLVAPLVLGIAAALAFWPGGARQAMRRALAGALLVGLYGAAIAQGDPDAPLVAGLALLGGLALLLFLPQVRELSPIPALAMLLAAAVVAVPLAARLPASNPVIDYNSLAAGKQATFNWDHTYGPLDWPKDGRLVFEVKSAEPHYWKVATLDRFDGFRWVSSATSLASPEAEVPSPAPEPWHVKATIVQGALESEQLISPGAIVRVDGLDSVAISDDGTARTSEGLGEGATYTVEAYAPDPTAERMRAAGADVPGAVRPYTGVELPLAGSNVYLPRFGAPRSSRGHAVHAVLDSPYAPVYRLAHRLTAGAPSTYEAVLRIQEALREGYRYDEDPPKSYFPLKAFLFHDKIGYCQQFSGAMALMLRMDGIPARVAAGFATGKRDGRGTFSVQDTDAHSWVEVFFDGIGWVPFDPTPPAAPAVSSVPAVIPTSQLGREGAGGQFARKLARENGLRGSKAAGVGPTRGNGTAAAPKPRRDAVEAGAGAPTRALALALAALGCVAAGRWGWRQRARFAAASDVDEVRAAFEAAGHPVAGSTLLALESRLDREGHVAAARYLAALRRLRYERASRHDHARGRRALRRAVTRGRGPAARARTWIALPPRLRGRS